MTRLVTPWEEHDDTTQVENEAVVDAPVITTSREDVLRVLRRTFEHHFRPREIAGAGALRPARDQCPDRGRPAA
jgi:hypothetical protein